MRFVFIILGACLLFTNLSLKAVISPSDLAQLSSEKQEIYQQLKAEFPHLFQRIDMYDEALKERDKGSSFVASHLKIEDALSLRFNGLMEAWSQVEGKQRVFHGLSSFYNGLHESQQLHREILAILNSHLNPQVGGGAAYEVADVDGGASHSIRIRHRGQITREADIEEKSSDTHDLAKKYPFPQLNVVITQGQIKEGLKKVQTLLNYWYDPVAVIDDGNSSVFRKAWNIIGRTVKSVMSKPGPDQILRKSLYFLAGNQGKIEESSNLCLLDNQKKGRDSFLSFLLYQSLKNKDWLPSFDQAVTLFKYHDVCNLDSSAKNAILSIFDGTTDPENVSFVRKNSKEFQVWHVQLFSDNPEEPFGGEDHLRRYVSKEIKSHEPNRVDAAYKLLDDTLIRRVPSSITQGAYNFYVREVVKPRDQKALQNILEYSKGLDTTYKKEGCRSCFGTKWKVARRNLRYLVEQFNKNYDKVRPLQDLLSIYQDQGVHAALEKLQWGYRNSFSIGSDVQAKDLVITDAIWHENLNSVEASL